MVLGAGTPWQVTPPSPEPNWLLVITAVPTITTPAQMTGAGMILGTAAYQVRVLIQVKKL